MTNKDYILLLGARTDPALRSVQKQVTSKGYIAEIINNVSKVPLSVPLGTKQIESRILLSGNSIDTSRLQSILVSHIFSEGLTITSDPIESEYVQQEAYAAWYALLWSAECFVMNRPSLEIPLSLMNTVQLRAFIRRLGIPTVGEIIYDKHSAVRHIDNFGNYAALDLSDGKSFWDTNEKQIRDERLYSMVDLRHNTTYVITVRVASELFSFLYDQYRYSQQIEDSIELLLFEYTRLIMDSLKLTYGYCVYALKEDGPEFTALYTWTLPDIPTWLSEIVSKKLVKVLLEH